MPILAAAAPPFLAELVALLVFAALIAYVAQRLRLTPVVAFLAAGVLIGPHGLGLVRDMALIDALAEIGVLLLLFTIGMELSLERLAAMRWLVVGGGTLQMLLSGGATAGMLVALGVGWRAAVFTGALVALSSTVIVLKLLGDEQELDTPLGRNALGILLFQDLAIVVLVLVLPVLAESGAAGGAGGGVALAAALARGVLVVAIAVVVARRVMPPILEAVARTCSPETFLLTVLAIGLGTAWLTSLAGVSLSLGAFLAGLLVSESRFSDQAVAEILPFQILFSAIFFVSVGLLLDVGFAIDSFGLVIAVVAAVLVVKTATGALAVRLLGQPWGAGLAAGLVLAQVGEFSFVLERAGRGLGLAPAGMEERGSQSFIAAVVLLMVATPLLVAAARRAARLGGRFAGRRPGGEAPAAVPAGTATGRPDPTVALLGWGPVAAELARLLAAEGRPVVVVTLSPDGAAIARAAGHRVVLGDYSKQAILEQAGVRDAAAVVVAEDEPRRAEQLAALLHASAPATRLVVRVASAEAAERALAAGADVAVADRAEAALAVLRCLPPAERAPARRPPVRLRPRYRLSEAQGADPRCAHTGLALAVAPWADGCVECLADGTSWVHLRVCATCGHVGCCDSPEHRHASAHARQTGHPILLSAEPGESWGWCARDRVMLGEGG